MIDWESMPGTSTTYAGQYDQGETATHEAGHWLNLEHTFFGGCSAKGDFVDGHAARADADHGCPEGRTRARRRVWTRSTTTWTTRFDSCYTQFTAGQTQRMRDAWLLYRAP